MEVVDNRKMFILVTVDLTSSMIVFGLGMNLCLYVFYDMPGIEGVGFEPHLSPFLFKNNSDRERQTG